MRCRYAQEATARVLRAARGRPLTAHEVAAARGLRWVEPARAVLARMVEQGTVRVVEQGRAHHRSTYTLTEFAP